MPVMITSIVLVFALPRQTKVVEIFSLVVFGRRAYWNGIQLTKKRLAEEITKKVIKVLSLLRM